MKKTIFAFLFLIFELHYVIAYIEGPRSEYIYTPDYEYADCIETRDLDYNIPNSPDYVEVLYLSPEKVRNIIEFLNKYSSTPGPEITQRATEETTSAPTEETTTVSTRHTEETTTPTTTESVTTTPTATTTSAATTTSTESITTFKEVVTEEVEDPIEDVINIGPDKKELVTTSTTNYELPLEPSPEEEDNEDDNDFERDSEEDILSIKKPEKIRESTTPEDENNSKPKDIYRWF